MDYTAPVDDIQFVLHDMLCVSESDIPGYSDMDPEFTEAVLGEAGKSASNVLAPLNTVGDEEGSRQHTKRRKSNRCPRTMTSMPVRLSVRLRLRSQYLRPIGAPHISSLEFAIEATKRYICVVWSS